MKSEQLDDVCGKSILLAAAMGGVLSFASACGLSDKYKDATPPVDPNAPVKQELSLAEFTNLCDARGGLVETHMVCSNTNTCAGLSYNKFSKKRFEHTCAAKNNCGGLSCIDLAEESAGSAAKTGEEIYKASCAECHAAEMLTGASFKVFVKSGATSEEKENLQNLAKTRTETARMNLIAFGTKGFNTNGQHFANMPAYYQKLSVSEVKKVAAFVGTLDFVAEEYQVLGQE